MPTIKHFTKSMYLPSIMDSGCIFLEGYNTEKAIKNYDVNELDASVNSTWKNLKLQYKVVGRYVWFTEQDTLLCSTVLQNFSQTPLLFEADDIGAMRWYEIVPRIIAKQKRARKFIDAMHETAIRAGDNPAKWWVTKTAVDIKFCKNISDLTVF